VAEIQERTIGYFWYHVGSNCNTADHISRGLNRKKLKDCETWWHGPSWIQDIDRQWSNTEITMVEAEIPKSMPPITISLKVSAKLNLAMLYK